MALSRRRATNAIPAPRAKISVTIGFWTVTGVSDVPTSAPGQTRQQGQSATRLVVPNEQTLIGVGGRSLQCQLQTHALQQTAPYSITSSARAMIDCGTVRSSALTTFRLMTSWNLVG